MEKYVITLDEFLALPVEEVARVVRTTGPQVCVFPINGTRRWTVLEHGKQLAVSSNPVKTYMDLAAPEYIRLYDLLFCHGLDTIVSPQFGSELLTRGQAYVDATLGQDGTERLFLSADFLNFYKSRGVRVRVYGDYARKLADTPNARLIELFGNITKQTYSNTPYRLFYGMFADDVTQLLIERTMKHATEHSVEIPDRHMLTRELYGEEIDSATLFIGFEKPVVFDYPLLSSGLEDLYFTYSPSFYLDQTTLRTILYDHLYLRNIAEPSWGSLPPRQRTKIRKFYHSHCSSVLGIGSTIPCGDTEIWIPKR
jgi:adenosine tuberculosinyltransferase